MSMIGSRLLAMGAHAIRAGLPQDCLLCGAESDVAPLCTPCRRELPALPRSCPRCAMPSPLGEICGSCLRHPPQFDITLAVWRYAYPVDRLVQALKFHGRLALASFFAEALSSLFASRPAAPVDVVIPMPLHPGRLAERGFNQAAEIARHLTGAIAARSIQPRLALQGASRIRRTLPQAELPFDARARNVRGAFACALDLNGARVAVVDDVMTTGATLGELAKVLKQAGAARVENWVMTRTLD
jgi:ComF family protein